jgi:threonine dehydratase
MAANTCSASADSPAPQRVGEKVFSIAKAQVDSTTLVTDEAIRQAQKTVWRSGGNTTAVNFDQ